MLRRRREELGLSPEDVAARLGISAHVYGTWERTPAQEWSDDRLIALVEALEMSSQQSGWLFRLAVDRDPPRAAWSTPLRPSGPVPPSGPPVRPPGPARPAGPSRPSGPAFPAAPPRPRVPAPSSAFTAACAPAPVRPSTPSLPAVPADPGGPAVPADSPDPETQAYLRDYATMMDAVPLPSLLFDRRWDVAHTNPAFDALFRGIGPHPTAMPGQNFLRFVLFHPDAGTVLGEHETSWCLPLMAQLESALEGDDGDEVLQAIRQDIALDPIMDAAYRCGLPHWMRAMGAAALHHDGAVRPLRHPDPRWGRTDCRIVDETPQTLQDKGFTRMTLVLRETRSAAVPGVQGVTAVPGRRRGKHLRAVSGV
ncbi:helix-turn-helix domain-containing protein [Streptomyces sp. NBC_01142]|uniref:helix-turn-helix domain-containing protein n=1 Tax=Streptomyces sp. NBC_01142 TaxID=2975865 RepID=UPI0022520577|nr:helix-turn-helix domain-containing protein [Streptomyces sp. NBC_01142]MCX4820505.1 helix-turn-helix domain-containing protein [Streptomyces sp. NBC_01142]